MNKIKIREENIFMNRNNQIIKKLKKNKKEEINNIGSLIYDSKKDDNNQRNMRNADIRISAKNIIKKDNELLGLKVGDIYSISFEDIIRILEDWKKQKKCLRYYAIEHYEDPDNIHFHIVIDFGEGVCQFQTIKNKFPYGDIERCEHGVKACVQYLVHFNDLTKYQYDWSEVVTNAPDKLVNYKIPGNKRKKALIENLLNNIIKGEIKECDINKIDPSIYIDNERKIKAAFEYYRKSISVNTERTIKICVLDGPSRSGKSTFCQKYAREHKETICFSSGQKHPWDNYKSEDIFVFDDLNPDNTTLEDMIKAIDPHIASTNSNRYHDVYFAGSTIFITTNIDILSWFMGKEEKRREAFFKRIDCVIKFYESEEEYISAYRMFEIKNAKDEKPDTNTEVISGRYLKPLNDKVNILDLREYLDVEKDKSEREKFIDDLCSIK